MSYERILSDVVEIFSDSTVYDVTAEDSIDDLALGSDAAQSVEDALTQAYPMIGNLSLSEYMTVGDVASAIQECMD